MLQTVAFSVAKCYNGIMKRIMVNFSDEELTAFGLTTESGSDDVKRRMGGDDVSKKLDVLLDLVKNLKVGTIQNENSEKTKDTHSLDFLNDHVARVIPPIVNPADKYVDVIEWIEKINDPEYQSDSEERSKINKMVKDAGLSYNARDKKLWKQEGEKWILIKEF